MALEDCNNFLYRHFQGIQTSLADMVHKVTALRVKVPLLSGDHVLRIMAMDTHLEVCLHLKTTTHPTAATRRSRDHQEVAWAGTRGRALHPILRTRVVLLITTSRDLSHMIASHRATLLGQGITTVMVNHRVLTMANLNTRNMRLSRTTAMGMVILDTMLPLRTSSTMVSRQWARSKAILNSQIPMLGLHTVDLVNGLPGVLRLQMALTRRQLHLMGRLLSTLLLMGKRTVQQLDLMDMLNRVTHSRVGRHQLHMVRVHQQLQAILSSKVAMHSTHRPNQHMVSKQLKPMRAMGTRELQQILTMEVPTHSQDMVLLVRLLVRLVMPPQQPASLRMARQDTPSRLQILQVMSSLRHQQQPRAAMLRPQQIHSSLLQQKGSRHSLVVVLLHMVLVGSGQHDPPRTSNMARW
ncbi:KH domain-containing protein [Zea mays]|uniref:KH domain-containing protein n=1 Tax=Zea mays TaxID=4577 RepID=A0A1D6PX74_MAIZE|nr:KH domain-containing protein [Zea mays]